MASKVGKPAGWYRPCPGPGDPRVLVADETTAGLDVGSRERVLGLLTGLAAWERVVLIASDDPQVLAACSSLVR